MKRGFKTRAERLAESVRRRLLIPLHEPLPARMLAEKLNVSILRVDEMSRRGLSSRHGDRYGRELETLDSAATVLVGPDLAIVYHPAQSPARLESRLMREMAHVLLEHAVVEHTDLSISRFDAAQEAEAAYLGGCLQIPRQGLLWALHRDMSTSEIARHFGASVQIVRYRRNVTGADRQLAREPCK